jgi:hypothetical protein
MTSTDCPHCGRANDRHANLGNDDQAAPGDVSICFGCHHIAVFAAGGMRKPTPAELAAIEQDPLVRDAIRALRAAKAAMS